MPHLDNDDDDDGDAVVFVVAVIDEAVIEERRKKLPEYSGNQFAISSESEFKFCLRK